MQYGVPDLFAGNAHNQDRAKQNRAWRADDVAPTMHVERACFIMPIRPVFSSSTATSQDPAQRPRNVAVSMPEARKGLLRVFASLYIAVRGIPKACMPNGFLSNPADLHYRKKQWNSA